MSSAPSVPIPPPPFFPRVRLPELGKQRGARQDDDPLFPGANKMQQRRREIEAELQRGYDLPADPFMRAEQRVPLFGRPPPVPKPPGAREYREKPSPHLPPINRSASPSPEPHRPESWRKPWQQPKDDSTPNATPRAAGPPPPPMPPPAYAHRAPDKPRTSLRGAHEAREHQKAEDKYRDGLRRQRAAAEAAFDKAQQNQEEQDWESHMRQRFQDEQVQIERERQRSLKEAARRAEEQARRDAQGQREAAAREGSDEEMMEEARRAEAAARQAEAAAAQAKRQAERVRRRMEQDAARGKSESPYADPPKQSPFSSPEPQQNARNRKRHAKRHQREDPRTSPRPAAYMHRELNKSSTLTATRKAKLLHAEAVKQAEAAAVQQLAALQQLPTKKEREKGFKELLRAWHPDKNPSNAEVATAVFQRLQADRFRALGA